MGVEILVLGGEKSLDHPSGNRLDRHEDALLDRIFREKLTVARLQPRHGRRLVGGQLAVVGKLPAIMVEHRQHGDAADDTQHQHDGHRHEQPSDEPLDHVAPALKGPGRRCRRPYRHCVPVRGMLAAASSFPLRTVVQTSDGERRQGRLGKHLAAAVARSRLGPISVGPPGSSHRRHE